MARPSAEAAHIFRLLREKLTALEGRLDPSLGFDAVTLYALGAEALLSRQTDILGPAVDGGDSEEKLARFLDRVSARLGEKAVSQLAFTESYWPERASTHGAASAKPARAAAIPAPASLPRPPMLLPRPEPIDVIVRIPDYPPRRFTWRRRPHVVTRAEGPERISPEWWEAEKSLPARDYYIVEDEKGQRFWLYREGVYGKSEDQRWFMHGLFP
jgi:protein ImuB